MIINFIVDQYILSHNLHMFEIHNLSILESQSIHIKDMIHINGINY